MKALTICQPYAELILAGEKRVENRTWPTRYRGRIYIHAGKSRAWLRAGDLEAHPAMVFGAVVGTALLADCLAAENIQRGVHEARYPGLRDHVHVAGPFCWVLEDAARIEPFPYSGKLGLFDISGRHGDGSKSEAETKGHESAKPR